MVEYLDMHYHMMSTQFRISRSTNTILKSDKVVRRRIWHNIINFVSGDLSYWYVVDIYEGCLGAYYSGV